MDSVINFLNENNKNLLRVVGVGNKKDYFKLIREIAKNSLIIESNIRVENTGLSDKIKGLIVEEDNIQESMLNELLKNNLILEKDKESYKFILKNFYELKIISSKLPLNAKINIFVNFICYILEFFKKYINQIESKKYILFLGEIKINDNLLACLLSLMKYNVIYFNCENDLKVITDESSLIEYEKKSLKEYIVDETEEEKYDIIKSEIIISNDTFYILNNIFGVNTDYYKEKENLIIPHYFIRTIGVIDSSESEVFNLLNKFLAIKIKYLEDKRFKLIETQKEFITNKSIYDKAINKTIEESDSFEEFVENLDAFGINIGIKVKALVKKALVKIMYIMLKYSEEVKELETSSTINDLLFYIRKSSIDINDILENKKFYMIYGNVNESQVFFIYFLSLIGFNISYISLDKKQNEVFENIENILQISSLDEYGQSYENIEFPDKKLVSRSTVAYETSEQLGKGLFNESTGIFKPYQFDGYDIVSIGLKTTYEEVNILANEEARMRPNFGLDENLKTIYIPNLISKICGVSEITDEYIKNVNTVGGLEKSFFMSTKKSGNISNKIEFIKEQISNNIYDIKGNIDYNKVVSSSYYKYGHIKLCAQNLIINKINEILNSKDIFNFDIDNEKKKRIISVCLGIKNEQIIDMIHSFNYYSNIPKLVTFINIALDYEYSLDLSICIAFLGKLGFDVIMYSPTGYTDIERFLSDDFYTIHRLQNINSKIELKKTDNKIIKMFGL